MKQNKVRHTGARSILVILAVAFVAAVAVGLLVGYEKLRDLWLEQCVVTDMASQVTIESGKMVKADVIAENFGLKVGANLALIDFAKKRKDVLKQIPELREITIRRKLPAKVSITIEERVPVARMGIRGSKARTVHVVDTDGVVFRCARDTRLLPVIREPHEPGTALGHTLAPRARAALQVIALCRETEFQELGLLEIDISKPDFLVATLGESYAMAKIAWEGMDEVTPAAHLNLVRQITHLRDAIRSRVGEGAVIWNATDFSRPGCVWADTKGKL